MPDWFAEFLKQSPTLGVCLLVVYVSWKAIRAFQQSLLELLLKSHADHPASKDSEIAWLRDDVEALRKERDRLQRLLNQRE